MKPEVERSVIQIFEDWSVLDPQSRSLALEELPRTVGPGTTRRLLPFLLLSEIVPLRLSPRYIEAVVEFSDWGECIEEALTWATHSNDFTVGVRMDCYWEDLQAMLPRYHSRQINLLRQSYQTKVKRLVGASEREALHAALAKVGKWEGSPADLALELEKVTAKLETFAAASVKRWVRWLYDWSSTREPLGWASCMPLPPSAARENFGLWLGTERKPKGSVSHSDLESGVAAYAIRVVLHHYGAPDDDGQIERELWSALYQLKPEELVVRWLPRLQALRDSDVIKEGLRLLSDPVPLPLLLKTVAPIVERMQPVGAVEMKPLVDWLTAREAKKDVIHWMSSSPVNGGLVTAPVVFTSRPRVQEADFVTYADLKHAVAGNALRAVLENLLEQQDWIRFDNILSKIRLHEFDRDQALARKAERIIQRFPGEPKPDATQARIIASPAKTIRVTARAGSGKTMLLTALTHAIITGYGYSPDEVLLLAFNKKAAGKLEEALARLLKIPAFPGARTFHSLAYGVCNPEQKILYDAGDSVATKAHSSLVQCILGELLDDELLDQVYALFRRETAEAKSTGAFLQGEDAYDFRRALTQYTLAGEQVKSRGEKFIADFLFEHGIIYAYERPTRWEGGWYRPDFTIKVAEKTWIVWEHWAVDPDAPKVTASADWTEQKLRAYQASAKRKREFWSAKNIPLVESCAENCGDREAFEAEISAKLRPFFPKIERLPREQLIAAMKQVHLSKLSGWVGQAIQRAQKRGWDAARLRNKLAAHFSETERERLFLELVKQVFTAYEPRLQKEGKTDFDRLFNEAIRLIRADPPQSILHGKQTAIDLRDLRICLVDEAQDLSPQFIEAVTCLRELNPRLRLLFVGDDWQAINRFAGSDVELFTEALTTRFGKCATPTLATNYRSVRKVVLAGNALMRGQGSEAVPHKEITGTIQLAYMDQVFVEMREGQANFELEAPFREFGGSLEKFFKALYQLAILDLQAGRTLGVLFRTNQHMGKSLNELERQFVRVLRKMGWPREDVDHWRNKLIRFSTAHGFKGLECHTVFIVNPSAGSFPLLNADSIELFRFFGDNLNQAEQDERRLFYVAITRAEQRLVFLTEKRKEEDSPYLEPFRDLIDVISVPSQVILPPSATKPEETPLAEEDRSEEWEENSRPWETLDSNQT